MNRLITRGLFNALGIIVYVSAVSVIMQNGEKIFSNINEFVGPVAFLILFVLSAAVTGGLVLGKPVMLYLSDQKNEAVKLFIYTLCWLTAAMAILLLMGILFK
jgi:hypothetical protein